MGVLHQPARSAAENLRWRSQLPAALLGQSVERSSADCVQAANRLVGRTSSRVGTLSSEMEYRDGTVECLANGLAGMSLAVAATCSIHAVDSDHGGDRPGFSRRID